MSASSRAATGEALVVGVDGSGSGARAIDWAVREAACRGVPLRMVHAFLGERYEEAMPGLPGRRPPEHEAAERVVAMAAGRAARLDPSVPLSTAIVAREPVAALLAEADRAAAIVVGHRGKGDVLTALLGSTAMAVAARAPCPVIVARGAPWRGHDGFGRITLAVGGRGRAAEASRFAFAEARARGAELVAVHPWRGPGHPLAALRPAAEDADAGDERDARGFLDLAVLPAARRYPEVALRRRTPRGPTSGLLLDAAASSDLVVVEALRHPAAAGLQVGPVGHALLHHAACAVAVVPQPP